MLLPGIDTYFFELYHPHEFKHGGIGNKDTERIFIREGFQPIRLPEGMFPFRYWKRYRAMKKWVNQIAPGSVVAFQFPLYPRMYQQMVRLLAAKNVKILIYLVDIDGLKSADPVLLKKELRVLQYGSHFIAHGSTMETWLRLQIPSARIVPRGPIDFLAPYIHPTRSAAAELCFAGNLEKSPFLLQMDQLKDIRLYVYGEGLDLSSYRASNLEAMGTHYPAELPALLKGNYGLIWDGDSAFEASGAIGNYHQYIYPHKLSLYILAGMPVIAPKFSGAADFIRENRIGWLIDSLADLPALFKTIDEESYAHAAAQIKQFQQPVSEGRLLPDAIRRVFRI